MKTTKKRQTKSKLQSQGSPEKSTGGARARFLSVNPKAQELQDAHLKEITARIGDFRIKMVATANDFINLANDAREIGLLIIDFLDTLPGKQLTTDFWLQLEGFFRDPTGNKINQEQLKWFIRVAQKTPEPFTNIMDAMQWRQPLLLASGAEELKLEIERPLQVSHAPSNPLSELKTMLAYARLDDVVKRLRLDINYCPNGKLRQDLRETLIVELKPTFDLVDELRKELEL